MNLIESFANAAVSGNVEKFNILLKQCDNDYSILNQKDAFGDSPLYCRNLENFLIFF